MTTVIVGGAIANKPCNGGNAWAVMNWALGLRKLGCTVVFAEQIEPAACVDGEGAPAPMEQSNNLAYFHDVMRSFGMNGSGALVWGERIAGMDAFDLRAAASSADILVNISGHITLPWLKDGPRLRVYVDLDPGFTQFWHAAGLTGARLEGHDVYLTIGENIGRSDCSIPMAGIPWRTIRQPVVLDLCTPSPDSDSSRFTTVGAWRGPYGPVQDGDRTYGVKVHEFRRFLELPRRAPQTFEIALDIHAGDWKDREALEVNGWVLVDPREATGTPERFHEYVSSSGAEFSAAQGVYVHTNSGWFSDRSVHYLACGKPVLVQDTGFSENLPTGAGLLAFRTSDDAAAGANEIAREYGAHSRAARSIAEGYFDSSKVLGPLLDDLTGVAGGREVWHVAR